MLCDLRSLWREKSQYGGPREPGMVRSPLGLYWPSGPNFALSLCTCPRQQLLAVAFSDLLLHELLCNQQPGCHSPLSEWHPQSTEDCQVLTSKRVHLESPTAFRGADVSCISFISYMESGNQTRISEFILLGLLEEAALQPLLFWLFLCMYLITFIGNLFIILAIITDSHLHTPMYFFLSNLSFADFCFTSTTVPKMLLNIQMQTQAITYEGCFSQMMFFMFFGGLDNFILTAMAYDRFVAICHPLHYMVIMNPRFCSVLLLASWFLSIVDTLLHGLMALRLSFCAQLEIPHFFCELNQVIQLACSDTFLNDLLVYFATGLLGIIPLTGILFSYSKIVSSILRISSASGKYKAFSTCGSHLSVVSLFYGTGLGVYLSSAATDNPRDSAIASVMYTVVTPMMNPFIYSLRNKDIKQALVKIFRWETALA
ncbi:Olfactory receptor 7A10 [Galemys pyrenaicus]|uniref:Olfactory receptor 7A10 n=1 Tax=Galemys pyrenaicus TaxID=202257 RepID=A0A8J6AEA4_GALPY|nr:Olfactory receptor 7A10 [Galemys pyrenaicus]